MITVISTGTGTPLPARAVALPPSTRLAPEALHRVLLRPSRPSPLPGEVSQPGAADPVPLRWGTRPAADRTPGSPGRVASGTEGDTT